jgi:conjugative relaxase-like TrwC/TraI family protein
LGRSPALAVVAVMTVHKLTAGDGYTYLTRQVASMDERRAPGQSLADYYTARGNPAGVWMGSGAKSLRLEGTEVSEAQMKALFGEGHHPNRDALLAAGLPVASTRLGASYPRFQPLPPREERVAAAVAEFEHENDRPPTAPEKKRIVAKEARRERRPVAGFDLVFTPVKSASLLWGLGDPEVRRAVEDAHHEAVASTIAWLERHAAFTRTGHGGTAQIDTTGLVCAAFDHRDSRSGDPDLHTHVAVANKVCGIDGKWRALDARGLHALGVAASERYNTRVEDALARRLGVEFTERPGTDPGKRPVREIASVPLELIRHFSKRRAAIEDRYTELVRGYRREHSREPDRSTQLKLAQQATLETREGKEPGRTLAEQVADWTDQAVAVLGKHGLARMLQDATGRTVDPSPVTDHDLDRLARQVVHTVSEQRSTWTRWNVYAEAERALRPLRFPSAQDREQVTEALVARATGTGLVIGISEPELITEPDALRRSSDGQSVYVAHGSERYTTSRILQAEEDLVTAALTGARVVDPLVAEAALAVHESTTGLKLDSGQRQLVAFFASYAARLALGIGPAGAGKTTAMRAFTEVWTANRGRVVPLASSSRAAQVLAGELDLRAENLHKFLHELSRTDHRSRDPWFTLGAGDMVLVDEAGMAGTLQLAELVARAQEAGAVVRLLGDPAQLSSVEAGGALRLLESEVGAAHLDQLHRFVDPAEAAATLALRRGDTLALDYYHDRGRVHDGNRDAMLEAAYEAWATDIRANRTSVLIAATGTDVAALNARARTERVDAGQVAPGGIDLRDGNRAGVGDWIVTRSNHRALTCHRGRDWVKNGDTWTVTRHHADGSLAVRHMEHGGTVRLPADYVTEHVDLGYAATAHRSQGSTVDTAHALVTPEMTREALYVASTRARAETHWYTTTEQLLDANSDHEPDPPRPARELLVGVLGRTVAENSATGTIRTTLTEATSLPALVVRYEHARDLAARDALTHTAEQTLPAALARRLVNDPAAGHLARALAAAAGRGADTTQVLKAAVDFDDLHNVRSLAAVLATRIQDYGPTLGVPRAEPGSRPLPWLDSPDVGHPGWRDYLERRADLIAHRAQELGSLTAAYREQYQLSHLPEGHFGEEPPRGTRRYRAFHCAARSEISEKAPAVPQQRASRRSGEPDPPRPNAAKRPDATTSAPLQRY